MSDTEKSYGVIYARYSSHNQREESIEDQVRECRTYAERNNIVVLKVYADKALSGTTDHRPEFQQMIKDSSKKLWQYCIVYKVDRFARDRYDSANYRARLKKNGVKVLSAKEAIPDGPEGIILESVLEGYAEYYSANLSQNICRGMEGNARKCKANGVPIFGYKVNADGCYEIDEQTAPIVRKIFENYAAGESQAQILKDLHEKGIHARKDKPFSCNGVHFILCNEKYTGIYKFGSVRVEGGIPVIIDKDLFDTAQHRMNTLTRKPVRRWNRADYLLTSKLFCRLCGSPMVGRSGRSRSGAKYDYYSCAKRNKIHDCSKDPVSRQGIEDFVIDTTCKYILQDDMIDYIADKVIAYQKNEQKKHSALDLLEAKLSDTDKALKNLEAAIEAGIITRTTKSRLKQLETEQDKLTKDIEIEKSRDIVFNKEQIVYWMQQFQHGGTDNQEYRRQLIDTFINSVFLDNDGNAVIVYNYSGPKNTITLSTLEKIECTEGEKCSYKSSMVNHRGFEPRTP